jgi:hypothetical protein
MATQKQKVLDVLYSVENGITSRDISGLTKIAQDQVDRLLRKLLVEHRAYRMRTAQGTIPALWAADGKPIHQHEQRPISHERMEKVARRKMAQKVLGAIRADELRWERAAADKKDELEQRWLNHALSEWASWMRSYGPIFKLSYPRQCHVTQGGWLVKDVSELYEASDRKMVECVDAIITGLPESQRASVWIAWGIAEGPPGSWCVDKYQAARASIFAEADKRGVVVL